MPGTSKDASVGVNLGSIPPAAIRNKKRAAMATSVVSMANNTPSMREYKKTW